MVQSVHGINHPPDEVSTQLGQEDHRVQDSVFIRARAIDLYDFLKSRSNLKRILPSLQSVLKLDDYLWLWEIQRDDLPRRQRVRFLAEVIEAIPGRMISWRTTPQSDFYHAGSIWFLEGPRGTEIKVHIKFKPLGGQLGHLWALLWKKDPGTLIRSALQALKAKFELT